MKTLPVSPDPAASVIVIRQGLKGLEVLMVRRNTRGFFGGLVVFPGGGLDEADSSSLARAVLQGDTDDHVFRSAALRELAEETGLLVVPGRVGIAPESRGTAFYETLVADGISLAGNDLVLVSRWVTPEMAPRRFDTFFYVLGVESTPEIRLDTDELVGHAWVEPGLALQRHESGEWPMFVPTLEHLRWLTTVSSVSEAVDSAHGADERSLVTPYIADDGSIIPIPLPECPT